MHAVEDTEVIQPPPDDAAGVVVRPAGRVTVARLRGLRDRAAPEVADPVPAAAPMPAPPASSHEPEIFAPGEMREIMRSHGLIDVDDVRVVVRDPGAHLPIEQRAAAMLADGLPAIGQILSAGDKTSAREKNAAADRLAKIGRVYADAASPAVSVEVAVLISSAAALAPKIRALVDARRDRLLGTDAVSASIALDASG